MKCDILKGKHILVTGASSGIGRGCALLFSQLGAKVTLMARNQERLQQTLDSMSGEGHNIVVYDLDDVDGIEIQIKEIVQQHGKLDGLMYCAGDCYRYPLSVCKPDLMRKSMQINYFAFVEMLRCISKKRNSNDGASLIGVTSDSSLRGDKCLLTLSASKAAMNNAVRCAARELAVRKIRVNAISASYVVGSRMVQETIEAFGSAQVDKIVEEQQPLGVGQPKDIANAAAFLLSEDANFITGTIMLVDGGYMA